MPEPEAVRVNGLVFHLADLPEMYPEGVSGRTDPLGQMIHLGRRALPRGQARALLRECLGLIDRCYCVALEDRQVGLLEAGLWALIQDNPGLAEHLAGTGGPGNG